MKASTQEGLSALLEQVVDCIPFETEAAIRQARPIVALGNHRFVASQVNLVRKTHIENTIICCDDCAISNFNQLVLSLENLFVLFPNPSFAEATNQALDMLDAPKFDLGSSELQKQIAAHCANVWRHRPKTFCLLPTSSQNSGSVNARRPFDQTNKLATG